MTLTQGYFPHTDTEGGRDGGPSGISNQGRQKRAGSKESEG